MGNKSSKTSNKARQVKHENQYPDTDISDRRHGDGDSPKPILRSAGPELSQQTRFLPHIPQFPPLSVHKDMSCQTNDSYLQAKSQPIQYTRIFIYACIALVALYIVTCGFFMWSTFLQSLLVYVHWARFPMGDLTDLPRFGLIEARNINIDTEDRLILRGWHLIHSNTDILTLSQLQDDASFKRDDFFDNALAYSSRIVVFFHGNAGTRGVDFRVRMVKQMALLLEANVIAIDYRGFGDSMGSPSENGTNIDARAVINYIDRILRRARPNLPVFWDRGSRKQYCELQRQSATARMATEPRRPHLFLYGHSLGTAVSVQLAQEMNRNLPGSVSGIILDAPFTTLVEASMSHPLGAPFRVFPFVSSLMRNFLQFKYPTIDRIHDIGTNLLLLHGTADFDVPVKHSRQLFEAALNASDLRENFSDSCINEGNNTTGLKTCTRRPSSKQDIRIVRFVEFFGVDHNGVHRYPQWVSSVADFVSSSEKNIDRIAENLLKTNRITCEGADERSDIRRHADDSLDDLLKEIESDDDATELNDVDQGEDVYDEFEEEGDEEDVSEDEEEIEEADYDTEIDGSAEVASKG